MKPAPTNRILMYTMIAIIAIATYITINSYYTQLAIYEEKEMFKLDCIANAVAYKISGEEHDNLVDRYPTSAMAGAATGDSTYKKIHNQLAKAKKMTQVPSEMYTVVKDPGQEKFYTAIGADNENWLSEVRVSQNALDSMYTKGGMIGRFETPEGTYMGAISRIMNKKNEVVGVLQVNETFDSFMQKSKNQVYFNILLSLTFIIIIGIMMFISVKAILRRQQKLASEKLEVEQLRTELLANISHDIRTPLASIHGYVETLLMKGDSLDKEQATRYLNTTLQSTEKLKTMVDELFDLSKLESKERKLKLEQFDVSELLLDVAHNFKVSAQEKGVEIATTIPTNHPRVIADIALIDRVLNNLIGNALKYCDRDDKISVSIEPDNGNVLISVKDTGSGIPAADLPHIFNRFYQGKTSKKGSGLGLAIVKSILDLHNSHCEVKSEEGEGTEFRFSLKMA